MPIVEEEIDGLSGLLFPFYDPDTHMLYLAGKVSKLRLHISNLRFDADISIHVFSVSFAWFCLEILTSCVCAYREMGTFAIMRSPQKSHT